MVSKILSIKSNKMTKQQLEDKAKKQLGKLEKKLDEDPIKTRTYYKITG
jgi:hypothetical protein